MKTKSILLSAFTAMLLVFATASCTQNGNKENSDNQQTKDSVNMEYTQIELSEIHKYVDPIVEMRDKWFLVTAEKDGVANTLTAGWGALGNLWEKKVAIVYIRPQRHTKKFMDESGRFTMTFFEDSKKEMLFLGSHSGADMPDKIEQSGLHLTHVDGQPTFEEGKLVLNCKILYAQQQNPDNFIDKEFAEATFPDKDYSVMYVAEIESAYKK